MRFCQCLELVCKVCLFVCVVRWEGDSNRNFKNEFPKLCYNSCVCKDFVVEDTNFFCSEAFSKSQEVIRHFWHNTCTRTQVFVALVCGTYAAAVSPICWKFFGCLKITSGNVLIHILSEYKFLHAKNVLWHNCSNYFESQWPLWQWQM